MQTIDKPKNKEKSTGSTNLIHYWFYDTEKDDFTTFCGIAKKKRLSKDRRKNKKNTCVVCEDIYKRGEWLGWVKDMDAYLAADAGHNVI